MKNKFLITTPIFYPNAEPHLGSVHTMVLADFHNRCLNKLGYDSILLTGLDEHGNKVYNAALKDYEQKYKEQPKDNQFVKCNVVCYAAQI